MGVRERRLISAMTPEAKEKRERLEAEGRDPITGRNLCGRVECGCALKHDNTTHTAASAGESANRETGLET
jgi:hypothetical protein